MTVTALTPDESQRYSILTKERIKPCNYYICIAKGLMDDGSSYSTVLLFVIEL
jgi:hypothetical protein